MSFLNIIEVIALLFCSIYGAPMCFDVTFVISGFDRGRLHFATDKYLNYCYLIIRLFVHKSMSPYLSI